MRRTARVFATDDLTPFEKAPEVKQAGPEAGFDLEAALRELPPGARAVFVLHDVEGYKHEEIARMMGIAVGTSKAQLHRARGLLREVLQPMTCDDAEHRLDDYVDGESRGRRAPRAGAAPRLVRQLP